MPLIADRITRIGTENAFKVGGDIARAEAAGVDVIRFNLGEPDFDSPVHVNEVGSRELMAGNSHYCDAQGLLELRQAIAGYAGELRNLRFDPEHVVVTPGGKPPIGYTMMAYVNAGDEVIYPSPGFPVYESWITYVRGTPVPLHLSEERGFAFTAAELEPLLSERTKVIIINSPSNPTGGVLTREQLDEIAALIRERCSDEVRVLSDEIYDQILFDGHEHHSIAACEGMQERTIVLSGHSKSFAMTGWRLGYCICPTALEAGLFKNFNINTISCVPPFVQLAGREALVNPLTQDAVAEMLVAFSRRRELVVGRLNAMPGVSCANPSGAFYVFPNIGEAIEKLGVIERYEALDEATRARTTPSTLTQMFLLYQHGVATMDRRSFGAIGCEGQHFLRLSIATDDDSLNRGLDRIEAGLADHEGFAAFVAAGENLW